MSDCANVAMREMLPEYLHGRLDAMRRAAVDAHLLTCADCAAELETLRAVRSAFAAVRTPDVATIVAALPKPGPVQRARPVRRLISWQLAAALAVAMVGGLSFVVAERFGEQPPVVVQDSVPGRDTTATVVVTPPPPAPPAPGVTRQRVVARETAVAVEPRGGGLGVGAGIDDLNTEQLEALIRSLDELEAAPAAEPARGARIPVRSELR